MRSVLVVLALALAVSASLENDFAAFTQKFHKVYRTDSEFQYRFGVFQENMKKAEELNRKNPLATFGATKFSDLTQEEFAASYLMKVDRKDYVAPPVKTDFSAKVNSTLSCNPDPTNYDWNSCNVITPVYNQGQCGSCWAFSATETIESYYAIAGYPLTSLAMEQIVSCDTGSYGCNGGWVSSAFSYVQEAGGIENYNDYPYTAENGVAGTCAFNDADAVATLISSQSINGETGLYQQTSSSSGGPVSVCVDASTWSSYINGIMTSCPDDIDHCVQLTGYANYGQSGAYWIVRNSWGTDWGINGYLWIAIGQDLCAIGDMASVCVAGNA